MDQESTKRTKGAHERKGRVIWEREAGEEEAEPLGGRGLGVGLAEKS